VSGAWSSVPTAGASQATATALGTVYAKQTTGGGSPYLTAFGSSAAQNTTGSSNTAVGNSALYTNVSGTSNCAFGINALYYTTGNYGVAVGESALQANISGWYNVGIGYRALFNNTIADSNTAVGHRAGYYQTGGSNTAVGVEALFGASGTSTGTNNTGIGFNALYACTSGYNNVALGYQSLNANNSGYLNTCIGTVAGLSISSGNNIVCVGYYSGQNISTGSTSTYIGSQTSASAAGVTGEVLVSSYGAAGKGVNTAFITGGGGPCYAGNNSATWAVISDQRLKKNIVDNNVGLDKIVQIQVRNFEYRTEDEVTDLPKNQVIKKEGVQLGAIAQELQQILPDCVTERSTGVLSVDSDNIMWHMINAIKELNAKVIALETKLGV
jgi:hypothetical protein